MTINHAILGILSCRPMTGYDLKKIIQESDIMHWSGNNNQVYKALIELHGEGLVISEVRYQESLPSKKIYTVTEEGLKVLREWTALEPEPAELRKPFLLQLKWADILDGAQLQALLANYENQIRICLAMSREKARRGDGLKPRSSRESFLWKMIDENAVSTYQNELDWIQGVQKQLSELDAGGADKLELQDS